MAIAFIPVRGGSKSIPLKNIKPLRGRPLLYYAVAACAEAAGVGDIYVATDSDEIKRTALSFGFPGLHVYDRSPENAADTSSTEGVMAEFIQAAALSPDEVFVLVQATNPFITGPDIDGALAMYSSGGHGSVFSAVRSKRFFWNNDGTPVNYDFTARPRRQDLNGLFMENGAFYINSVRGIMETGNRIKGPVGIYEMPEHSGFEIDEPDDWDIAEMLLRKHVRTPGGNGKKVRLFATDVDGVLTDAGMYYSEAGDELKRFNTYDGMAFSMLRKRNVKTAIITSEQTRLVEKRGKKLEVDHIYQGVKDKLAVVKKICCDEGIELDEIAYIGDDINDVSLLSCAGISACPGNAVGSVKAIPGIIELRTDGGKGAVREFVEYLIASSLV